MFGEVFIFISFGTIAESWIASMPRGAKHNGLQPAQTRMPLRGRIRYRPAQQRGLKPEVSEAEERRHIRRRICGVRQPKRRRESGDDVDAVDRNDQRLRIRLVADG